MCESISDKGTIPYERFIPFLIDRTTQTSNSNIDAMPM